MRLPRFVSEAIPDISGGECFKSHFFFACWVRKGDRGAEERDGAVIVRSVFAISDQRMLSGGKLHADLVCSAGLQTHTQKRDFTVLRMRGA